MVQRSILHLNVGNVFLVCLTKRPEYSMNNTAQLSFCASQIAERWNKNLVSFWLHQRAKRFVVHKCEVSVEGEDENREREGERERERDVEMLSCGDGNDLYNKLLDTHFLALLSLCNLFVLLCEDVCIRRAQFCIQTNNGTTSIYKCVHDLDKACSLYNNI